MKALSGKPILIGVAFLLPLFFIAIVFFTSYISSIRLSTDYDFVYAICREGSNPYSYNCSNYLNSMYAVDNGTLRVETVPPDLDSDRDTIPEVDKNYRTRLFFHDTGANESREIALEEAQNYGLSEFSTSPDNVAVEWEAS